MALLGYVKWVERDYEAARALFHRPHELGCAKGTYLLAESIAS